MIAAGYVPGGGAQAASAAHEDESGAVKSGDVFVAIRDYVERNPDVVQKVATVFQFRLRSPDSVWTLDLKNGKGSVAAGETPRPECTLELSDEDFIGMTSGSVDPMKLYSGGKLKIDGNAMAAQKLTFLKKMDPEQAKKAVRAARAAARTGSPGPAPAPSKRREPVAAGIFRALGERLGKSPALADEIGAVVAFRVTDPDGEWTVEPGKTGGVKPGRAANAGATVTLSDEDLGELARGASAKDLFQRGRLRVDGDVRVAHKLGFLKGLT